MVSNIANAQVGMTYTYVSWDREKYITHSNTAAIAGTLPQAGASFPDGWKMYVHNIGAGTLTITPSISTINGALTLVLSTGKSAMIISDGTNYSAFLGASTGGGTGDVAWPASATDNAFARFNTTTGKLIKNSQTTEDASGNVVVVGNIRTVREGINKANAGNAMLEILNTAWLQGQQIENDTATRIAFSSFVTGDGFVRFTYLGDWKQEWGNGAAVADTNLYRGGANILKTDDAFEADSLKVLGIDTEIEMTAITNEPTAPIAGRALLYVKSLAGRMFLKVMWPSGFDVPLQAHQFHNTFQTIQAGSAAAFDVSGNAITNVGTITHPAIADTNLKTRTRRGVNTSVATAGGLASTRVGLFECSRNSGFYVVARFALDTLAAGNRAFVGLTDTATTAPTNIDPTTSTTPGKIGMAINANTGNWNLVHNITGTVPTVIALGASFPVDITTMYEIVLFSGSAGANVGYRITNQTTNVTTSGTLTTNIPALATLLGRVIWATNNATASAVAWSLSKFGLETDY